MLSCRAVTATCGHAPRASLPLNDGSCAVGQLDHPSRRRLDGCRHGVGLGLVVQAAPSTGQYPATRIASPSPGHGGIVHIMKRSGSASPVRN